VIKMTFIKKINTGRFPIFCIISVGENSMWTAGTKSIQRWSLQGELIGEYLGRTNILILQKDLVFSDTESNILIFSNSMEVLKKIEFTNPIGSFTVNDSELWVVNGGSFINVYEIDNLLNLPQDEKPRPLATLSLPDNGTINSIVTIGKEVLTSSEEGEIFVWSIEGKSIKKKISVSGNKVSYLMTGEKTVWVSTKGAELQIFETEKYSEMMGGKGFVTYHSDLISCIIVLPQSVTESIDNNVDYRGQNYIWSVSLDRSICVWKTTHKPQEISKQWASTQPTPRSPTKSQLLGQRTSSSNPAKTRSKAGSFNEGSFTAAVKPTTQRQGSFMGMGLLTKNNNNNNNNNNTDNNNDIDIKNSPPATSWLSSSLPNKPIISTTPPAQRTLGNTPRSPLSNDSSNDYDDGGNSGRRSSFGFSPKKS